MIRIQDGPASPVSPQTDQYYSALAHHDCGRLKTLLPSPAPSPPDHEVMLFSALDDLCFAVRDHTRTVDWAKVAAADQAAADLTHCLQRAAHQALHSARLVHQAQPGSPPSFARAPKGTACRPAVRAVALVDDPTISTAPYLLVVGDHLFEVQKISVAGVTRTARLLPGPDAPNWLPGQDCGAAILLNPPDVTHLASTRIRVQGQGYTVSYTWQVSPTIDASPQPTPADGSCSIAATSASAGP